MARKPAGTAPAVHDAGRMERSFALSVREGGGGGGDGAGVRISISSEEPYSRWWGTEILDHSEGAVDLARLNEIGVLLFNHDPDDPIGKIDRAWLENGRLEAEVTFDLDDPKAARVWSKVKNGFLKGVSVGYNVSVWEEVEPGKPSTDGRFAGPCSIARKWEVFEASIVSLPADPTVGVGRADGGPSGLPEYETRARQLEYNASMASIMKGGNQDAYS